MYPNQDLYEGNFSENKRDGKGVYFYHSSRNKDRGIWENGKMVISENKRDMINNKLQN